MADEKTKVNLDAKLKYYIDSITKVIKVDQIVLFGSFAKGNAHEYSDIDIAVVSPELDPRRSRFSNIRKIKEKTNLIDPGLQLFAFPSETFEKEQGFDEHFIREIKKTGKVIYQKPTI